MGYGVVRPTIGSVINKVYLLTALHFICGAMYSVGVTLVLLDIASEWVAFFIFPLAFTLTAFYMWILSSLKATTRYLSERRQTFKCAMFQRLNSILIGSVAFVSLYLLGMILYVSLVGPNDFLYQSWKYRWFLLDGILSLLYFVAFALIAWTWRPTGNNMRLAMSDELATDEETPGAEYEIHAIGQDDLDRDALEVDPNHLHQLSQAQNDTGVPLNIMSSHLMVASSSKMINIITTLKMTSLTWYLKRIMTCRAGRMIPIRKTTMKFNVFACMKRIHRVTLQRHMCL